jgi:hypothetical protein
VVKRKIPRAVFEPIEHITAELLVENEALQSMVKKEAPLAIEDALQARKASATLFEVGTTGYQIEIPKQYWIPALEKCIEYKLEQESFEECSTYKKLIARIEESETKSTKKKPKTKKDGTGVVRNTDGDQRDT